MYDTGDVDYKEDFTADDIDFCREHPKADMTNNRIIINGKVYLAADKIMEIMTEAENHDQYFRYAYGEIEKLKEGEQE